jgi:hypothetical protein
MQELIHSLQRSPLFGLQEKGYMSIHDFDSGSVDKHTQDEEALKKLQEKQPVQPAQVMVMAEKLNASPLALAELLRIGDLSDQFQQLNTLAEQGDETARIKAEILGAELMELIQYHNQRFDPLDFSRLFQ